MSYTKNQVAEILKKVLYFPKGDNIISLKMVEDIKIDGKNINVTILFPKPTDPAVNIVINTVKSEIKKNIDKKAIVTITQKSESKEENSLAGVKKIIAVASGKGGVGKSTIAVNLAIALSKTGAKVGLLDTDIYGPSIPIMFGLENAKPQVVSKNGKQKVIPINKFGIHLISIGFFVDPKQALIWRGPMATNALNQLFNDAEWGELDYLVLDLPPGTGDIHLTLAQSYPVDGAVIVTTPQKVAMADVQKAISMFNQDNIKIPIFGLIENMSYFVPEELPDNKYYIFGKSYSKSFSEKVNIPFLGQIPIVQSIAESGDSGNPIVLDDKSLASKAFVDLANNIINSEILSK